MTDTTDTLTMIRDELSDRNLKIVAERTGLQYDTVWRISKGRSDNPSFNTISKLMEYLKIPSNP